MATSKEHRAAAIDRAQSRCEYCQTPLTYSPDPIVIDHIQPVASGGSDYLDNLAVSCWGCNGHKFTSTQGFDPLESKLVRLFDPRRHKWSAHFAWSPDGLRVVGRTAIGRASIRKLKLNREGVVNLRAVLKLADKHPPM